MTLMHTWIVFKRFRAGIFALASFLGLGVATVGVIMLVNGWNSYQTHHKAALSFLCGVDIISAVSLVLMTVFHFRPVADLVRVTVILIFQIGLVIVFTLSIPTFPCVQSDLVQSCKALESLILYGTGVACVFMFIFILILIPMLKQPLRPPLPPPVNSDFIGSSFMSTDFKRSKGRDVGSILTYTSWDRVPEKATDIKETPRMRSEYANSYFHKVQTRSQTASPRRPPPPSISLTSTPRNPFATPETTLMDLSAQDSQLPYLRPYTPVPSETNIEVEGRPRGSIASFNSLRSVEKPLQEMQTAILASPRPLKESKRSMSDASLLERRPTTDSDLAPAPSILLVHGDLLSPRKSPRTLEPQPLHEVKPLRIKRKVPQELSLDNHLKSLEDTDLSSVPRTPSPVSGPYSPNSFPATPSTGVLPSHPRLTMHLRELKMAKSYRSLTGTIRSP